MSHRLLSLEELRALPAPVPCQVRQIEPKWIDHNGHVNMAYYNVILDDSLSDLFRPIGFGPNYLKARNCSTMTAEIHVRYLREIRLGDPVQGFVRLLGFDEKRMHIFQELRHATEGWLATTSENISLHIDMSVRKVAPFPPEIAERLRAVAQAHAGLPRPEAVGRHVALPVKAEVA